MVKTQHFLSKLIFSLNFKVCLEFFAFQIGTREMLMFQNSIINSLIRFQTWQRRVDPDLRPPLNPFVLLDLDLPQTPHGISTPHHDDGLLQRGLVAQDPQGKDASAWQGGGVQAT